MHSAIRGANPRSGQEVLSAEKDQSMYDQQAQQFGGLLSQQAQEQGQQTSQPLRL